MRGERSVVGRRRPAPGRRALFISGVASAPTRGGKTISQRSADHAGVATVHLYEESAQGNVPWWSMRSTELQGLVPVETARVAQCASASRERVGKDLFSTRSLATRERTPRC